MSVKVLRNNAEIVAARAEIAKLNANTLDKYFCSLFQGNGWIDTIGDAVKSWDVLETLKFILAHVEKNAPILDIGAFCSEVPCDLHLLKFTNLFGIDLNSDIVRMPYCDNIQYSVANFMLTHFPDESFSTVTAISVIEHGFDGDKLLAELSRILKPGGFFIASVDYWREKISTEGLTAFGMDWKIFSQNELLTFFEDAAQYGLYPVGSMDFNTEEKTVSWNNRDYTFAWFALHKKGLLPNRLSLASASDKPSADHLNAKVAFMTTWNQPCGIATHSGFMINGIKKAMRECGTSRDFIILAENSPPFVDIDEQNVIRCWRRTNESFDDALQVLEREKVSILHIQFQHGLFSCTKIETFAVECQKRGIALFITFHSSEEGMDLCARLANLSAASFVHLEQSAVRLIEFGAQPEKVHVVPHGIIDELEHKMNVSEAKAALNLPDDLRIISSFGFFEPHKGIYEIIEAFPEVLASNPNAAFFFLGAGHPENSESQLYMSRCRDLAVSLGISDRVIFNYKFIPDEELHRYLQASDVIVMNYTLNRNEASGACAFAMAHRRPLVTSAVPPFMPLSGCTLQLSLGLGIGRAINTILERPDIARYLINAADEYIRKNSFTVLGANLLQYYGLPAHMQTECTVREPAQAHRPITIGIDARTLCYDLSTARGIGTYALHLLDHAMQKRPEWRFILFGEPDELPPPSIRQLLINHANCAYQCVEDYSPASVALVHIPDPMNSLPGFDSPFRLFRHEQMTVTFHDLIPLHYYIDKWSPESQAAYKKRLSELTRSSCKLLANSTYTAEDVINELGLSCDRVTVVHAGINNLETLATVNELATKGEVLRKHRITSPYYLYVGAVDAHKNFESVIFSFQKASLQATIQLIVVGKENYLTKTFSDAIEKLDIRGIVFTGFVPREVLTTLYANAVATLFLSRQEGFGFPVLEAMANGCPVISSNTTSLPEVVGDAGLLFAPDDTDGVSQAMLRLLRDQRFRDELRRRGMEQAKKFSWEKTAQKTIAVWEQMLGITSMNGQTQSDVITTNNPVVGHPHPFNITWHGPQFIHHSLALVSRELCLQLHNNGHRLSLRLVDDTGTCQGEKRFQPLTKLVDAPLPGPADVHIYHWYPPDLTPPPEGHWVMIQPWEMGSVPKRWIEVMNDQVDEVWVPTSYVRDCYIKSGMNPERIAVVPNGIDTGLFSPAAIPYPLSTRKRFRFLYVGSTTLERKGFDILISTYVQEFHGVNDVCLVVKDMAVYTGGANPIREQIADLCCQPGVPEILFLEQDLSSLEQAGLYTACSCFVHSYRAEGFSLPVAEAMASGLPVIVTGHGACLDFCDKTNAYLIPAREVQLSQKQVYGMDTVDYPWWAEPDAQATRSLMRFVYDHPEEAKMKGRIARERIAQGFTWQHARDEAEERLKNITSRPILRFQEQQKTSQRQDFYLHSVPVPQHSFSLLFIAPILPTFDRDSGSFRLYQLLKMLREEGHQITFLAQGGAGNFDPRPYQDALESLGIEVIAFDPERLEERTGIRINAPLLDLGKLLLTRRFDAAYIYVYFTAAYYLKWLRDYSPKTKIIIDSVDFHYLRERREAELARDNDALHRAEQTLRNEVFVYEQADLVIMVTDEDRRALLSYSPKIKAEVIPNIHPSGDVPPPFSARSGIMFVGNFFHTPNTDAVLYLVNEIMPLVRKRLPDIVLTIVGNSPPPQIQSLADHCTRVTGYVEELKPLLDSHRVSVAPLRFGAGMKGKVGEAMSAGIPVVASEVAAEGCGFKNGEDVLMAHNSAEFADMIITLYTNESLWTQLSRNGRRTMNDKFSPEALRDSIRAILSRTIEGPLKRLTTSSKPKPVDSEILEGLTGIYQSTEQIVATIPGTSPAVSSIRYPLIPLVGNSSSSILQKLSSSERTKNVLKRYTTED